MAMPASVYHHESVTKVQLHSQKYDSAITTCACYNLRVTTSGKSKATEHFLPKAATAVVTTYQRLNSEELNRALSNRRRPIVVVADKVTR